MNDDTSLITIFKNLNPNTIIITPNSRLSASLHKLYSQRQLSEEKMVWETPQILPLLSWMQILWQQLTALEFSSLPHLLTDLQHHFIWEDILKNAHESAHLLRIPETATQLKSAWQLLKEWQIDINHSQFSTSEDSIAFQAWAMEFKARCKKNNWVDTGTLPDLLAEKIKENILPLPQYIIFVGFTEISPQLSAFISACELAKSTIQYTQLKMASTLSQRISLQDENDEILNLALWAKKNVDENPQQKIACVIPNLDKIRHRVKQIFSEVCAKDTALFNISAGSSLLHYPLIKAAFILLNLYKKNVNFSIMNFILCTPFLGKSYTEQLKRANFDAKLRRENINKLNIEKFLHHPNENFSIQKNCPHLAQNLKAFFNFMNAKITHNYTTWATIFNEALKILGWPGERSLNSEEYQIAEAWLKLLNDFSLLDQVAPPCSIDIALQSLQQFAKTRLFQAKTPEAPIQILGVLEAAGSVFDALWVSGMDDITWPPQAKPHAFIPKKLQHELNMPHASSARELTFCQIITKQFQQSAPNIIFSHAKTKKEFELQVSPLIEDLPQIQVHNLHLPIYEKPDIKIFMSRKIETIIDEIGPKLSATESIVGGFNIIKQQALCPFKAYAEWRLHARELEQPLPGFRAKDRGIFLHKALELIWNNIQNQQTLLKTDNNTLNILIEKTIADVFHFYPPVQDGNIKFLDLEKNRLQKILKDWLNFEKTRAPFKIISNETHTEINLSFFKLNLRIDRIDELEDGSKLIIDYKSSKYSEINSWFSDRPEEPQLPLYSLLDPNNTIGISFAQVVPGEYAFKGMSQAALAIKGIKSFADIKTANVTSWSEQLSQWKNIFDQLSHDFYHGVAKVDPKNLEETCKWCALKALCRIKEKTYA